MHLTSLLEYRTFFCSLPEAMSELRKNFMQNIPDL